jgi:hypothetical protein
MMLSGPDAIGLFLTLFGNKRRLALILRFFLDQKLTDFTPKTRK